MQNWLGVQNVQSIYKEGKIVMDFLVSFGLKGDGQCGYRPTGLLSIRIYSVFSMNVN